MEVDTLFMLHKPDTHIEKHLRKVWHFGKIQKLNEHVIITYVN